MKFLLIYLRELVNVPLGINLVEKILPLISSVGLFHREARVFNTRDTSSVIKANTGCEARARMSCS